MSVHQIYHPLIEHKLGLARTKGISPITFRMLASEIGSFLTYEATKDLETEEITIKGWAGDIKVKRIKGKKLTIVPILRAGVSMLNGVQLLIPTAKVSLVRLYCDESTLKLVNCYVKLAEKIEKRIALVVSPVLATGGLFCPTVDLLKEAGCQIIKGLFMVAAPKGVKEVKDKHPDVSIYVAAIDEKLNGVGYILPCL